MGPERKSKFKSDRLLVGEHIVIVGNLGYPEGRLPGQTQIFRLNVATLAMSRVAATGEGPGWVSKHTAELTADGCSLVVKGGEIWRTDETLVENLDEWELHLQDWRWERLTRRLWPRWSLERQDGKRLHLWEYSQLQWRRRVKWDTEEEAASLRDSLEGEPDEEAYGGLYQPPVAHSPLEEIANDSRAVRIAVDGVTVSYNDRRREVIITIEGELPPETAGTIVEDCRNKLELVERSGIRVTHVATE